MRRILPALSAACAGLALMGGNLPAGTTAPKPAAPTTIGGVTWETSFAAAKARAARERKPILLLHLFGRLDEEFC